MTLRPGCRPEGAEFRSEQGPEVQQFVFQKLGPEIVDFGSRNGHLPLRNPRAQVGGFAPHLRLWVLKKKMPFFDPQYRQFQD